MFTFLYTAVTFNPVDQADNLKKYGGFIPGVRPGAPTARYLDRVLTRLTLPGAIFLGLIAVLPTSSSATCGFSQATARGLGGTSVLIVVGVALDAMRQMESQLTMRHYEGVLRSSADMLAVLLFGPPGAGKGTQAAAVAAASGVPHIATGDMFREHLRSGSELGRSRARYMDAASSCPTT